MSRTTCCPGSGRRVVRYAQVARAGRREGIGVEVVSDTTNPGKVFSRGQWTLMGELEANGTVPQYAGGHRCSLKFKASHIDRFQLDQAGGQTAGKLFGCNADEYKRAAEANKHQARRAKKAGTRTSAVVRKVTVPPGPARRSPQWRQRGPRPRRGS
ncbi:hypothetical protein [Streptomyces incanus]|uniref:Uncharacterized protein n=1 Tax=Streptomyces incanus TaxID=887453 RepID=A0ABW0XKJ5_9ACTN